MPAFRTSDRQRSPGRAGAAPALKLRVSKGRARPWTREEEPTDVTARGIEHDAERPTRLAQPAPPARGPGEATRVCALVPAAHASSHPRRSLRARGRAAQRTWPPQKHPGQASLVPPPPPQAGPTSLLAPVSVF